MSEDVAALLREIRDNQRQAIALQREHMAMYAKQLERVERINDKAEALQSRAARTVKYAMWLLPVVLVLLLMIGWPYLRYLWWWISQ
ncbi:hypothetical protein LVB87_00425 [Lysobacter sp. KIS68-7]|uniref:hypothetical protein n=1 Tax=Lysobacter sp. KIS68-7 TaxID=2904252 RepID=UPI001E3E29C6|nr:hypothetical protein [Lysobacter sp. KIS68-7]UHQ19673.1 hypothetical protein LVB87_00425 [Lysobacter sp. KIS68-7]